MIPRHYILDSKIAKIREKLNASTISKAKNYEKYKHLLAAFDGAEDLRSSVYGIKNIYKGYDAYDRDTPNGVMYTPSMEVIRQHMENKAEVIASAGGESDPERMSMSIASD